MEVIGTLASRIQAERTLTEIAIEGGYEIEKLENDLPIYIRLIPGGGIAELKIYRKAERQWQVVKQVRVSVKQ